MTVPATVPALLAELADAGIRLRLLQESRLEVSGPVGRLSGDLRERIARHKPELLEWLAQGQAGPRPGAAAGQITPDPDRLYQPFDPSDLQTSFLIGSSPGFEHYVRPHQYMEFDLPDLDPDRYQAALNRVLRARHKDLVVVRDDLKLQTVRDAGPVQVGRSDLRQAPVREARQELERVRATMERREPGIARWPWIEAHVTRHPGGARLHWNNNNLFSDAPGTMRLLDEVLATYRQPDRVPVQPEIGYRDCVLALAQLERSPAGQAAQAYWTARLTGLPEGPPVPLAADADPSRRSVLVRRELRFDAGTWSRLRERAVAAGLTPTNAVLAAHAELLACWSNSRHFLLNSMITHRLPLHPEINQVIGNFASLYPLEVDWRPVESFVERAHRLQAQVISDVEHSQWSGVRVLQALNQVRRTPGRASCPFAVGSALFIGRSAAPDYSTLETPQVRFDCEFWELTDGSLWVVWDVIEEMFPAGLIDAMETGYRQAIELLADDEKSWQSTGLELAAGPKVRPAAGLQNPHSERTAELLDDGLARHAAAGRSRPAVIGVDAALTHAELALRCGEVATRLAGAGVDRGAKVAVILTKGAGQVVAVLAVQARGAAYVPLDPTWPQDRIRYLLADLGAAAVLADPGAVTWLAALTAAPVLPVDVTAELPTGLDPAESRVPNRSPDDDAYVIYTSGSTGRPKGVVLDHRGPVATIREINRRFGIGADDVVLGISSLCFDLSVYDLFGSLAVGATLVLPDPGRPDPASWLRLLLEHQVTVWNSVPAIMELVVEAAVAAGLRLPALRTVLLSGDWIPVRLPEAIRQIAPGAQVISLGGATEASIWSICYPVGQVNPAWSSIPYGRALAGQSWHILDELGRELPTWVPGELFIGGAGVARGYLNDATRTAASFVAHPRTGERLYRTGDLGRYLPSGDIEFLGRADFQVKIQGFRVEPGEVEHTLLEHPQVTQAAVVARTSGSGRQLAAFAVCGPAATGIAGPDPASLRAFLTERLPSYLVPARIAVLDRLPLTANGKLDRRALESLTPADESGAPAARVPVAASTATERLLVGIWAEILEVPAIGVDDDFFDLGGQSFAALRVVARIEERTGRRVPFGALLEHRTIAALAQQLDTGVEPDRSPLVRLSPAGDTEPAGTPWVWVHPAGGEVLCYQELAPRLEGPVLACRAAGGPDAPRTVELIAAGYLTALRAAQPAGPYRLGGWSSGAVIALELAHQLEQRGERVERLVVLDAPVPVRPRPVDAVQLLLWFVEDLGAGFDPDQLATADRHRLAALLAGPDGRTAALAGALELARAQGTGLPTDPRPLLRIFEIFETVVTACNSYQPPRIQAEVMVIRAGSGQVGEFAGHPAADAADWGWSAITTGRVAARTVAASHHTLLTGSALTAVVDALHPIPGGQTP